LSTPYPQIPYGWADFEAMRRERTLYVDKTRFLHELEREPADVRLPARRLPRRGRHLQRYTGMRHGYVIELKYLKRGEPATEARVAAAAREAVEQLQRYVADQRLARQYPSIRFTGLALVFHGWQLVHAAAHRADRATDHEFRGSR